MKNLATLFLCFLGYSIQAQNSLIVTRKDTFDFQTRGLDMREAFINSCQDGDKMVFLQSYEDGNAVRRIMPDGSLDNTFGKKGIVLLQKANCPDTATSYWDIVMDANRNIYLAGNNDKTILVTKLKPNGAVDLTFGTNGIRKVAVLSAAIDYNSFRMKLKLDRKGRLLVLADYLVSNYPVIKEMQLYRLSTNGVIDPAFVLPIKIHEKVNPLRTGFSDFAIDSSNNVIVTSSTNKNNPTPFESSDYLFAVKIKENATFDNTYGTNGIAYMTVGKKNYPLCIVIDSLDNCYISGSYKDINDYTHGSVYKLDQTGKLVKSFGNQGGIYTDDNPWLKKIAIYKGKLYGFAHIVESINPVITNLNVRRWSLDGVADPTFNGTGSFKGVKVADATELGVIFKSDQTITVGSFAIDYGSYTILLHNISKDGYVNAFGTNGVVTIDDYIDGVDEVTMIKEDNNGNLFLGGIVNKQGSSDYGIVKVLSAGTLDKSFGNSGKVALTLDPYLYTVDIPYAMNWNTEGNIYLAGASGYGYSAISLQPNGKLNTNFGSSGKIKINPDSYALINDAIIANDKILYAGFTQGSKTVGQDLTLIRLKNNGTLDSTFNGKGSVVMPGSKSESAYGVVLDSVNNMYVSATLGSSLNVNIFKFKTNGQIDSTFAVNGLFRKPIPTITNASYNIPTSLKFLKSGHLLSLNIAKGSYYNGDDLINFERYILLKMNKTGKVDSGFATNGFYIVPDFGATSIKDMYEYKDGSVLITMQGKCSTFILRLLPSGKADTTFGTNGVQEFPDVYINKIAARGTNELYLAGRDKYNFLIMRTGITDVISVLSDNLAYEGKEPFEIRNDKIFFTANGEAIVYDFTGKISFQHNVVDNNGLATLNEGYYIFKFKSNEGKLWTRKIAVVKH